MLPLVALAAAGLLSSYANDPAPWLRLEANSDQRQPLYLGLSPRELQLGLPPLARPRLWASLQGRGERQFAEVARRAGKSANAVELEAWPVQDDTGRLTWSIARLRAGQKDPWRWLSDDLLKDWKPEGDDPLPLLPEHLSPSKQADATRIFTDMLERDSLYDKPVFGDCVWVTPDAGEVVAAWIPTAQRTAARKRLSRGDGAADCRVVPQPARFNRAPISFVIKLSLEKGKAARVEWPEELEWLPEPAEAAAAQGAGVGAGLLAFPDGFAKAFVADLRVITGIDEARYREPGQPEQRVRFERKSSAQTDHQLDLLEDWLAARYRSLGLTTQRQRFWWHGLPQSNLIAVLPATAEPRDPRPVLLADHVDTAFCEDEFARTGRRVSAPGADDDGSGVAALLRAAALLSAKDAPPRHHEVWLVHLTGEEFPADDLGARHFLSESLGERRDFAGVVLLDMVASNKPADRLFQVNPGPSPESQALAVVAQAAARVQAPGLQAVLRERFDPRSYLYNTDGLIFADAGYPVVLLNEHLNRLEHLDRRGYHDTFDTLENFDTDYAVAIVKVALETVARLAK